MLCREERRLLLQRSSVSKQSHPSSSQALGSVSVLQQRKIKAELQEQESSSILSPTCNFLLHFPVPLPTTSLGA